MVAQHSLWMYFISAGMVVKLVMLILLAGSVISWMYIFQRVMFFNRIKSSIKTMSEQFWSGADLASLYVELKDDEDDTEATSHIFKSGFKEFLRIRKRAHINENQFVDSLQRAMRIATKKELCKLEKHLPFLATIGSISPYIGLFGTVWGIMVSFQSLGNVQQATIAMVAPGISEALIATAMGLFAAIPAVIAYNRFANQLEEIAEQYEIFQEELTSILLEHTAESHAAH